MSKIITALNPHPRHPDRVEVYLDHQLAFAATAASVHGLRGGEA